MSASRIQMSHPLGQTPPNVYSYFDWIRRHGKELLAQYGSKRLRQLPVNRALLGRVCG